MPLFAEKVLSFCLSLNFKGTLPPGISIMNPFRAGGEVMDAVSAFYRKYYSDSNPRKLILGINPGRFGGGVTGIPFTDTVRLKEKCGLEISGFSTYETSSVFIYDMIERYGGPAKFYSDYYISSVIPLGFTKTGNKGNEVNFNYYDSRELSDSVKEFAVESIFKQIEFGINRDVCFCLGTGKNYSFLSKLNNRYKFFDRIVPLEHPRFIMQYRSKQKEVFLDLYIDNLKNR